jgi:predicted DNA-binding transcriptional regulator YafY
MSANKRIQWLHSRISTGNYPNANHLAAKFGISHRQAQRDVDFLRVKLGAPLEYNPSRFGYYYTEHFSLPIYITSDNDDEYSGFSGKIGGTPSSDSTVIQMQIPYTAEIEVKSRLGVVELKNLITAQKGRNRYVCEFHSVELFLGMLVSLNADVKILSPEWLRERAVEAAERILKNNKK